MPLKGTALDARLQHQLLLDPKLQRRLSGEEFRSYINLTVWTVSLVSDGVFDREDAEMVITDLLHIDKMVQLDLIQECEDTGKLRFHPDHWGWQSTKAELEKMATDRANDRLRKRASRAAKKDEDIPPPPDPDDFEAEQPF